MTGQFILQIARPFTVLGLCLAGCGSPTTAPGTPDTTTPFTPTTSPTGSSTYNSTLGPDPDFSEPHGRIRTQWWLDDDQANLTGHFADGTTPQLRVETERSGNCRVMGYTPSLCEPACAVDEACVNEECVPYPSRLDRGDLTWTWPDGDVSLPPSALLDYWHIASASTAGETAIAFDGLTLLAPTVRPVIPTGDWNQALSDRPTGADVTLSWSNPIAGARVRLAMTDCVGSHGGIGEAEIECEGPDSGELVMDGGILDALDDGDWTRGECGSHNFDRYHSTAPADDALTRFESFATRSLFYRPD
jgi:hypothetical protein